MNLSTRQLRAFVALAEERSFTRAAALMHLSQPAFSALVRSLEESLEQRLFDRTTRHVELSTEGRAFEPAARRNASRRWRASSGCARRASRWSMATT